MKKRVVDPDSPYDPPCSPFGSPHILLNKVVRYPKCGCRITGHGTLPSPARIKFCDIHAAATPEALK